MTDKLAKLLDIEGYDDLEDFLDDKAFDSVCPGICTNEGCDYTTEVEPDQDKGWCELCGTQTVESGLSLAGVI